MKQPESACVPICWICRQEEGTTGEHRLKRSDLKAVLGAQGGIFLHTAQRSNRRVQSIDSKHIKFAAPMCGTCNNARTQPHDLAWEELSANLRTRRPPLKPGDFVRDNRIFRYDTSRRMMNMHLFFVKWLGCQIVETSIPIVPGICTFSNAIMAGAAHANIWLSFGLGNEGVSASDVCMANFGDGAGVGDLVRFYNVGIISVRVRFSAVRIRGDWHPKDGNRIVIGDFRE